MCVWLIHLFFVYKWVDFAHFFNLFWRCFIIAIKECSINEEIKAKEVRLIDVDGSQLGVMSIKDAMSKAEERNLDLVEISPQAVPPVCKVMDYGKYRFEQAKREKETKKNQKIVNIKEVKMSPSIDVHDFNTKVNQATKFLKNGDKVRVKIRFRRARELSHMNLSEELMSKFMEACAEYGASEKPAKLEGKNYMAVLAPKTAAAGKKAKNNADE